MMEYQRKPAIIAECDTVYEPVAYDKSITVNSDGRYQPTLRINDKVLLLPAQLFLRKAQKMLDLFDPDPGEFFNSNTRYLNALLQ